MNAPARAGWRTSTTVSFCAAAWPTVSPDDPDAPALLVLGEFLRNGHLHRAIREQGGAYGAGAGYNPDSDSFRMFSYRDPRLAETFDEFRGALDWLFAADHDPRNLEEAVLGVIAAIDKPGSPAGEAVTAYFAELFGRTPEWRR
ncbi:MAG: insulinase family protein, partial [Candidatus Competibacterales bacterium]|nr:insulinase family protein [Candidatus Competibacterales bacterium]